MTEAHVHNDSNVYILGAGFSVDGGLPVVSGFLNRMRDSLDWLEQEGWEREAKAVKEVLGFRLAAASAAHRVNINIENIEELFSLAAASEDKEYEDSMVLAIAATLEFARRHHTPPNAKAVVPIDWATLGHWESPDGVSDDVREGPVYDYYVALMAGVLTRMSELSKNTFITFNYDTLLEDAAKNLGFAYDYRFAHKAFNFENGTYYKEHQYDEGRIPILKLHGSLNWAFPGTQGGKLTIFDDYAQVQERKLTPVMVPPTWRKSIEGRVGDAWEEAVEAIKSATRIYIVGFSIPETDPHFKYLLAAGLRENISLREVCFVNPSATDLEPKVLTVLRPDLESSEILRFVPKTVGDYSSGLDEGECIFGRKLRDGVSLYPH